MAAAAGKFLASNPQLTAALASVAAQQLSGSSSNPLAALGGAPMAPQAPQPVQPIIIQQPPQFASPAMQPLLQPAMQTVAQPTVPPIQPMQPMTQPAPRPAARQSSGTQRILIIAALACCACLYFILCAGFLILALSLGDVINL